MNVAVGTRMDGLVEEIAIVTSGVDCDFAALAEDYENARSAIAMKAFTYALKPFCDKYGLMYVAYGSELIFSYYRSDGAWREINTGNWHRYGRGPVEWPTLWKLINNIWADNSTPLTDLVPGRYMPKSVVPYDRNPWEREDDWL